MTFHVISLCYSLSLCIFSSARCTISEEKPGAQLLPTHLSFPLSLASTDEAAQDKHITIFGRDVLYILYTHISEAIRHLTFRCACTASPVSWWIPVYKRCIAHLHSNEILVEIWTFLQFCTNGLNCVWC